MTYLWSFDPGFATGAALGYYDDETPYKIHATWSIPDGLDGFIDWLGSWGPTRYDDVVVERFIIDGTITGVWAPQIEGALSLFAFQEGFNITWHLRSDKSMLTAGDEPTRNKWLKARFPDMKTQHERDAVTHSLVYLKRQRHLPTLKQYWSEA
jgi:hypothetical protein